MSSRVVIGSSFLQQTYNFRVFSINQGLVFGLETPMAKSRLKIRRRKRRKRIRHHASQPGIWTDAR